jgi:hypothetical protein
MPVLSQNNETEDVTSKQRSLHSALCCKPDLPPPPTSAQSTTTHQPTIMMTPEAAASILLSIVQQPPRLNPFFPLSDVKLPSAADLCCRRDRNRIQSILQSGLMPMVNWKSLKTELLFELGRFLHRKTHAHFDFVESSCTTQHQVVVDIDSLLLKEQANTHVLNDKCMVHVVTFSSDVCSHTHSVAAKTTDISVELDEEIAGGIKAVGDSDQMQKLEEAVCTANCGATVRPQRSTLNTKSKNSRETKTAVGCARGRSSHQHKLGCTISILCFHASA